MRQKQKWRHEKYIPLLNHGFGDRGYWTFNIGGDGIIPYPEFILDSWGLQWWKNVISMMETRDGNNDGNNDGKHGLSMLNNLRL